MPPAQRRDSLAVDRDLGAHGYAHTIFDAEAGTDTGCALLLVRGMAGFAVAWC